jgi:hypothetical protein
MRVSVHGFAPLSAHRLTMLSARGFVPRLLP